MQENLTFIVDYAGLFIIFLMRVKVDFRGYIVGMGGTPWFFFDTDYNTPQKLDSCLRCKMSIS